MFQRSRDSLLAFCAIYSLSAFVRSEPFCEISCGPNADCVENNHCECRSGYTSAISEENGLPYCKVTCSTPCMEYAACIAPDQCECVQGYELADDNVCTPTCSSKCPNGICVAPEICECATGYAAVGNTCLKVEGDCPAGYVWDAALEVCMDPNGYVKTTSKTTAAVAATKADQTTKVSQVWEYISTAKTTNGAPVEHSGGGVQHGDYVPNTPLYDEEMVDDNGELSAEYSTEQASKHYYKCPEGFVYYKGDCRHKIDHAVKCNLELCGPHTLCLDNDKCACLPGYVWLATGCVSQEYLEHSKLSKLPTAAENDTWLYNFFTALGLTCIVVALLVLLVVLYKNQQK